VGVAEVTSEAYPDPKQKDPKLAVVDLRAVERLPQPVPLAEIKKDRAFADLALVRMGRLSVMRYRRTSSAHSEARRREVAHDDNGRRTSHG